MKVYSGFIYNHFVTSQNRKATGEWINKLQHIQTTDYYPALQRNRLLIHARTITVPSERGQTQMAGCFHLLWKRQHYRDREQDQWLQGLGVGGGEVGQGSPFIGKEQKETVAMMARFYVLPVVGVT